MCIRVVPCIVNLYYTEVSSCVCHFTPGERIAVTHRTAGWVEPRFDPDVLEKGNTLEDSDILVCDTVSFVSGYQHRAAQEESRAA